MNLLFCVDKSIVGSFGGLVGKVSYYNYVVKVFGVINVEN